LCEEKACEVRWNAGPAQKARLSWLIILDTQWGCRIKTWPASYLPKWIFDQNECEFFRKIILFLCFCSTFCKIVTWLNFVTNQRIGLPWRSSFRFLREPPLMTWKVCIIWLFMTKVKWCYDDLKFFFFFNPCSACCRLWL
jgi:hypothetical protein